jgi:hypothetical protein
VTNCLVGANPVAVDATRFAEGMMQGTEPFWGGLDRRKAEGHLCAADCHRTSELGPE